jgi:hypothetical protein
MFDTGYIKFDTELLICFIEHVVQNFIQYEVLLSNGQRGKIVMPSKKEPARPLIMLDGGAFIDLSVHKDIYIEDMYHFLQAACPDVKISKAEIVHPFEVV